MAPQRPFSELEWQMAPETVRQYIVWLEQKLYAMQQMVESHEKRIETLEVQSKKTSHNSSKPPSSDPPFAKKKRKQKKSRRTKGGQKGHEPHQQEMLDPTESHRLMPERCTCGHSDFDPKQMQPFYVHQHSFELGRVAFPFPAHGQILSIWADSELSILSSFLGPPPSTEWETEKREAEGRGQASWKVLP